MGLANMNAMFPIDVSFNFNRNTTTLDSKIEGTMQPQSPLLQV
jgi:hypothetical protein